MNLVFIHGRGQGQRTERELLDSWTEGLRQGLRRIGVQADDGFQTLLPFYGAELDRLTAALAQATVAVVERGEPAPGDADPFTAAIVERLAARAGVDTQQVIVDSQGRVVERGPENWEWVQAVARAAILRAPWLADFSIGRFTADVRAYLDRPHIKKAVHDIIAPAIAAGPCVVVSHSLGTVVAYRLLVELAAPPTVPLFITAGSPLGIDVIKRKLPSPLRFPRGVEKWLNVSDERDFVALSSRLDRDTFIEGIENVSDVDNGDDPHNISRYLADSTVARRIADTLGLR
jgi:hypothetical protein